MSVRVATVARRQSLADTHLECGGPMTLRKLLATGTAGACGLMLLDSAGPD